ncbi:DUF4153 domain-containing protein [Hymenobacter cellulosivorans]|uniref:DUF4153 domain-containing protein n=1 Tax=Hymenobacter cellulosivorans TaxID=2932249 RepID=A0ABY4F427_9BACT|nr:DUF4153 domain-containing protein [Hymenobacter cellulosivorans]UOQ51050.1 DUF4153 domain-containing protein [Hymenobacter cellulosivorans]
MKLPSLQHVVAEATRVVRRFPLTLLCALVLCVAGIYTISLDYPEEQKLKWLFPLASSAALGLTLTLSLALAAERYRWPLVGKLAAALGTVGLLVLWYVAAPAKPDMVWVLRLFVLLVASHLLVAVVPYLPELRRQADTPGFWRYNETLFLRILTAGLYSGVLYAGCSLALVAVKNLFDVKLDDNLFGYLFTVLATLFNTWFFLAGVPQDFAALEQEAPYPKGLKVFTQFVLLPLVVLYLGILYAYLGRIVVQWELPKGWVSILILAFSVAGIFALLLIHPIRDAAGNTWIRTFSRWFYRALLPLLGLLVVAINTRIQAYGFTEERYYVLVLAGWLAIMLAYFLWHQGRGIIWIPASLAVVALLTLLGPWSAVAVAERSQLRELKELSAQHQLLQNGRLDSAGRRAPKLPFAARKRITSIFVFFAERGAIDQLQPLFAVSLQLPDSLRNAVSDEQRSWQTQRLFAASHIDRVGYYEEEDEFPETRSSFTVEPPEAQPLGPGRYWLRRVAPDYYQKPDDDTLAQLVLGEGTFRLRSTGRRRWLHLEQLRADGRWQIRLTAQTGALADSLVQRHPAATTEEELAGIRLPAKGLTLTARGANATLQLYLSELSRSSRQDTVRYDYSGSALLELKANPKALKPEK